MLPVRPVIAGEQIGCLEDSFDPSNIKDRPLRGYRRTEISVSRKIAVAANALAGKRRQPIGSRRERAGEMKLKRQSRQNSGKSYGKPALD
jgi:hypothetical protein